MRTFLKQSALLFALSGISAVPVFAQATATPPAATQGEGDHPHRHMDPAKATKHLTKELGLSAEQASQVQPILADRETKMESLHNDATLDQATRRDRMHAIQTDTEQRLNAVFTDAQRQQFAAMRSERRHGHKGDNPTPGQAPSA